MMISMIETTTGSLMQITHMIKMSTDTRREQHVLNDRTYGMEENKWWIPTDFYPNSRLGITPNIWCTHTKLPPDGGGKRFSPPTDGRSLA